MKQTLFIASDHAGFDLKQALLARLRDAYDVIDCGPSTDQEPDDYPDFAQKVCEAVLDHKAQGILICDTGIGMSIAANRFDGIRAALVTTPFMAERSKLHNNANVLCLGQDAVSQDENYELVDTWLGTEFSAESRHARRIEKLDMLS